MWKQKDAARADNKKFRNSKERNEREKEERLQRQADEVVRGERALTKELEPYVFARRQGQQYL